VKLKPLGPPFGREVEAVPCPLIEAEQGVEMSPRWSVEQSLMLHRSFLWCRMGQRNGRSNVECVGGVPDESWLQQ
jgi:hypothetical protein